jgi:DNA mismatch repair protein MutS2
MLIPADIEEKLGFDRLRERLVDMCDSVQGKEAARVMTFTSDVETIIRLTGETDEYLRLLEGNEPVPGLVTHDLKAALRGVRTEGNFLEPEAFWQIYISIETGKNLQKFFISRREENPFLFALVSEMADHGDIQQQIGRVVDEDQHVLSGASRALRDIRTSLDKARMKIRKDLDRIFRNAVKDGMVPEKASITVRDGRMVIPVLAEYKRRIKGFIHDESATGQTIYLEPASVLESNNEIRELEYAEKREVIRILTELTDHVRPYADSLSALSELLGVFDFIRAKSRLALSLDATRPEFKGEPIIDLHEARHPLLHLNYRESSKTVVPVSLRLDAINRIIVISGPNAGGKSVALKTAGLIQYMWQCGLLVPAGEQSVMGVFEDIFIDIGDEQSIENDLSTYSSHLTLMKQFMERAGQHSLVLIDEFGTGTDPQFGGAIAEAILGNLLEQGVRGIITTHYSNIKTFAEKHEGLMNGAMKYDVERLEPLYMLQPGIPGSSFSFEVARKIGLPDAIISYARDLVGQKQVNVDELILKLEKQEQDIRERDELLKKREAEAERLESRYRKLSEELEASKKEIISKARDEASDLLRQTNREIEKTIRHIKENKAQKEETRKMRGRLDQLKEKVKPEEAVEDRSLAEVEPGDMVRLMGKDVTGEVLSVRGKKVEVQVGALKTIVKRNQLEKISNREARNQQRSKTFVRSNVDMSQRLTGFSHTLDVRGKRVPEALSEVTRFIDDAILFSANEVRILHGKGDGILRKAIQEHLKRNTQVEEVRDEHVERGGAGISVIQLR